MTRPLPSRRPMALAPPSEVRVLEVLADAYEALTTAELVALTGYAQVTVARTLVRLRRWEKVLDVGGKWVGA